MHAQPLIIPTNHGLVKNLEGSYEPPRPTVATSLTVSRTHDLSVIRRDGTELINISF